MARKTEGTVKGPTAHERRAASETRDIASVLRDRLTVAEHRHLGVHITQRDAVRLLAWIDELRKQLRELSDLVSDAHLNDVRENARLGQRIIDGWRDIQCVAQFIIGSWAGPKDAPVYRAALRLVVDTMNVDTVNNG